MKHLKTNSPLSTKYIELKEKFLSNFGKNLDDYEMFSQVQLKYNNGGDYFVADQVFVKYGVDDFGAKYIDDVVVIENKLSSSTALTVPQTSALQSNSYVVRSTAVESLTDPGITLKNGESLSFSGSSQWFKVHSDGLGNAINGIIKI